MTTFLPGLPDTIVRGYVQHFRVNTDLPEPTAKLYQIQAGDTAERLAVQEFSAAVRDGHDLRYYENVLLAVNRDKGRKGVQGAFQEPNILGGGANNIQLGAGRRIWLVSPGYARALEGPVPDGSLTGGGRLAAACSSKVSCSTRTASSIKSFEIATAKMAPTLEVGPSSPMEP